MAGHTTLCSVHKLQFLIHRRARSSKNNRAKHLIVEENLLKFWIEIIINLVNNNNNNDRLTAFDPGQPG